MKKTTRSLLLVVSAMFLLVRASQHDPIGDPPAIQIRAAVDSTAAPLSTDATTAAPAPTTTQAPTTAAQTTSSPAQATTAAPAPTSASPSKSDGTSSANSPAPATTPGQTPTPTSQAVITSAVATTNAAGEVVTSVIEYTLTPSNTGPAPSQSPNNNNSGGGGGGLSTGSIVGLSVAGGIAALGIILFFVWKFTRKRFSDFDDNEAIKWPELNAHNNDVHALPTNSTGRSGFGPENDSEVNLARAPSPGAYANSISGASSVPEAYGTGDPYAVPPLPHLNPNQPYRDEPGAFGQPPGFYDPYRGPVPTTFGETMSDGHTAEAIPMTQMAGMRSPGPQMAYDMQGRGSPVPQAAMGYDERSRMSNPTLGRNSPNPYGYGPR